MKAERDGQPFPHITVLGTHFFVYSHLDREVSKHYKYSTEQNENSNRCAGFQIMKLLTSL